MSLAAGAEWPVDVLPVPSFERYLLAAFQKRLDLF
jgi:hypothetical protein